MNVSGIASRAGALALSGIVLLGVQACGSDDDPTTPAVVDHDLAVVLAAAIQDEYHAEETYLRVLDDFGDVVPFYNIVMAEVRHSTAIGGLFASRGWTVPLSDWTHQDVPAFGTLPAACAAGVEAELANIALYDELLEGDLPFDVEQVFENVRAASLNNHLPAFERCR